VFHIYLPAASDTLESAARAPDSKPARTGSETILIVEDDRQVMGLGTAILERLGYSVLPAASAEEALTLLKQKTRPVDLLLTDVIMPGMNGKQLFDKISASYPGMRVLFMSGYTDNVIAHHGVIEPGVHFIQKPFSVQSLAAKVREVLDQAPPSLVSGKPS
jgi:DNA-binding NtrC family response regulator